MSKRWKVIVSYKPEHMVDETYTIEELSELHNKIEYGPDWNDIEAITITLNP